MKYTLISVIKIYINLTLGPYIKAIGHINDLQKSVARISRKNDSITYRSCIEEQDHSFYAS
jgi:hypothetical protein